MSIDQSEVLDISIDQSECTDLRDLGLDQGNTYHACAAAHIRGEEELMEYIRCMINDNYDPPRAALR